MSICKDFELFLATHYNKLTSLDKKQTSLLAFYLIDLVNFALKRKYDVYLSIVEIIRIRAKLKELDLFLLFSLVKIFFSYANTLKKQHD